MVEDVDEVDDTENYSVEGLISEKRDLLELIDVEALHTNENDQLIDDVKENIVIQWEFLRTSYLENVMLTHYTNHMCIPCL